MYSFDAEKARDGLVAGLRRLSREQGFSDVHREQMKGLPASGILCWRM